MITKSLSIWVILIVLASAISGAGTTQYLQNIAIQSDEGIISVDKDLNDKIDIAEKAYGVTILSSYLSGICNSGIMIGADDKGIVCASLEETYEELKKKFFRVCLEGTEKCVITPSLNVDVYYAESGCSNWAYVNGVRLSNGHVKSVTLDIDGENLMEIYGNCDHNDRCNIQGSYIEVRFPGGQIITTSDWVRDPNLRSCYGGCSQFGLYNSKYRYESCFCDCSAISGSRRLDILN